MLFRSVRVASAMATSISSAPVAASPKSDASPKSIASPIKKEKGKLHRLPADYTECKQALLDGKKLAEKALKRVQAKKKAEDSKKRRLTAKAQALEVTTLVKIVSMKVDIPDIVCPHCECSIAPGEALAKAYREVQKGRERHLEQPGKPLMISTKPTTQPSPPGGIASSQPSK